MICPRCRDRAHDDCPGSTWCDCQHHVPLVTRAGTVLTDQGIQRLADEAEAGYDVTGIVHW